MTKEELAIGDEVTAIISVSARIVGFDNTRVENVPIRQVLKVIK